MPIVREINGQKSKMIDVTTLIIYWSDDSTAMEFADVSFVEVDGRYYIYDNYRRFIVNSALVKYIDFIVV